MPDWMIRMSSVLKAPAMALAVSACAENPNHLNTHYLERFAIPNPTLGYFTVCHGFNCVERSSVTLGEDQWRRITAVFRPHAKNAQLERQQIARAVALIETFVGPQAGIAARQWTHKSMLVLPNLGDQTQIDCVDASVNTWTYMTLMERAGLLQFHRVAQLSYAGSLTDPDLRNTAVLQQIGGGYFAIDASLVDHGAPPLVMPLAVWMSNWPPDPAAIEHIAQADVTVDRPHSLVEKGNLPPVFSAFAVP